jgi:hypothetical protein
MEQLLAHVQQLLTVLIAAHAVAIAIVNLTPTPKDNEQVAKFYKVIEIFAGIITKLAKK